MIKSPRVGASPDDENYRVDRPYDIGPTEPSSAISMKKPEDDAVVKQLLNDSKPMWLTDQMIERPWVIVCLGFFILFAATAYVVAQDLFAMTPSTDRDFLLWDDPMTLEFDMKTVAEQYITANSGAAGQDKPLRMTPMSSWNPLIFFEVKNGGSLLEKKNLLKVKEAEDRIKAMDKWPRVCLATSMEDPSCSPSSYASSLSFLGPAVNQLEELTQEQIDQTWQAVTNNMEVFPALSAFYQKSDSIQAADGKLQYMRSFMSFGLPIEANGKRYKDILDEQEEQHDYMRDFQRELLDFSKLYETDPDIGVHALGQDIQNMLMQDLVDEDGIWAGAAVSFVFVFFSIKLKSSFLGFIGIFIILLSLPFTQFLSKVIFQNDYYSTLNSLIIFIILGIGGDNIFVFMDGWKQTAAMDEIKNDKRRRLAFAVKRSARATATTSGTTSVAFFANIFSPIMPFMSFGIFSGIIIVVNYCFILLIFPPVAAWYEDNLEGKCCICQRKEAAKGIMGGDNRPKAEQELGLLERFFSGSWNDIVKERKYPIIVVFVIWTAVAISFAIQLTPLTQQEKFLPDEVPFMRIVSVQGEHFIGGQFNLDVDIYWGIKDINKDKVTTWDANYIGEAVMDEEFDFYSVEAQQSLLDLCEDLIDQSFVLNKDVLCWTEAFNAYLAQDNMSMPLTDMALLKEKLWTWATTEVSGKQARSGMQVGFVNEELRYMKIQSTAVGDPQEPADIKQPIYDAWQEYFEDYKDQAPESMRGVGVSGGIWWAFIPSEKAFLSSAFQGMTIAGIFAFFVLLIATGNIIQALISVLCVAIIIVSVLAIMYFSGWEIGVSESVAMVILIGFSVDYCVHLSADFMHSAHPDRASKMQQAYKEMGVSILSGAITTCGSGVFLFGGQITMFPKFAVLITSTIAFSFLTSMLLFGALMHVMGPEGGVGDVSSLFSSGRGKK